MPLNGTALEVLSEIDLFANLDKHQLKALAEIGESHTHKPGKVVIRQGEKSESFQVVTRGKLDCYLWDDVLKIERPLTVFKRGDIFGEVGVLTDDTRSAFVRAQEESETVSFEKEPFFALMEKQPKLLLNVAKILAHRLAAANKAAGIRFDQLSGYKITQDLVQLVPLQVVLRHRLLPISRQGNDVTVAIVDPTDQIARNTASQFLNKYQISWVCVSQTDFDHFRDKKLFDLVSVVPVDTDDDAEPISYPANAGATAEGGSDAAKTVDELFIGAINSGASDLHFEPGPQNVAVRVRIDGRLIELGQPLSYATYKPIVSRIKVLADMDITETRMPQDSVLRIRYGKRNVDMRLSTVPAPHAEAVACRLFDPNQRKFDFSNLVVSEAVAELMKKLFFLPSGLVLVTGPTGSGKTTTLYAGLQLRQAHSPTNKIVSAEDPIEYELMGATQVQVNPAIDLSYERILRSLLRQDPDVILIGEIRDKSSMEIALEAALTGHFVLSSLHTNDSLETIARIRQRGVEPYVIASSVRGIISQKLVRRLCSGCAEEISLDPRIALELQRSGVTEAGETPQAWGAKGCAHCKMTGYKGRIAMYEVLVISHKLRNAIEDGVSVTELDQFIEPGTFVSMQRYARFLMKKGLVAPADLLEVMPGQATIAKL